MKSLVVMSANSRSEYGPPMVVFGWIDSDNPCVVRHIDHVVIDDGHAEIFKDFLKSIEAENPSKFLQENAGNWKA